MIAAELFAWRTHAFISPRRDGGDTRRAVLRRRRANFVEARCRHSRLYHLSTFRGDFIDIFDRLLRRPFLEKNAAPP